MQLPWPFHCRQSKRRQRRQQEQQSLNQPFRTAEEIELRRLIAAYHCVAPEWIALAGHDPLTDLSRSLDRPVRSFPYPGTDLSVQPATLATVEVAAADDPGAAIIVDARYLPLDRGEEIVELMARHRNVICLRAAATFGTSVPNLCWIVAEPSLARRLDCACVAPYAMRRTNRLMAEPSMLAALRREQSEAVATLVYGLEAFSYRTRVGAAPRVCTELGPETGRIAARFESQTGITLEIPPALNGHWLQLPATDRRAACSMLRALLDAIVWVGSTPPEAEG